MSEIAYIALGSNLGDRHAHLDRARAAIAAIPECRIVAATQVEETAPLGGRDQPPYLNEMIAVETTLDPAALLGRLQRIEVEHGRVRSERWASRTLDLDIVRFGDRAVATPELTVPHPALGDRSFWQRELAELAASIRDAANE